ncbi:MAG: flagellin, partial [Bacillota bacterium]
AAGLAISEKMGSQVRGLAQAQRNAQDGISMIQTAEGALKESHSILQRMRELAVQSSNDTNTTADRAEIQKEVDQLSQELSRIGETTEFNTQKLLDGTVEDIKFQIGANEAQNMSVSVNDMRGHSLGAAGDLKLEETTTTVTLGTEIATGTYTVEENSDGEYDMLDSDGLVVATSTDGVTYDAGGTDSIEFENGSVTSGSIVVDETDGEATATVGVQNDGLEAGTYNFVQGDGELLDDNGEVVATLDSTDLKNAAGDVLASFETSAPGSDTTITVGGVDISSQSSANNAIKTLDDAIANISEERSKLGSAQNRLDHTINNLNTAQENLTAAESRISDVDMAQEMMSFTKNQILSQAGTAMMAQANQLPQGVLQLLG